MAAIAARRTSAGHELFAAEGHAAIAAIACLDPDFCFINEHRNAALRYSPLALRLNL
jgi:hypothetical protein